MDIRSYIRRYLIATSAFLVLTLLPFVMLAESKRAMKLLEKGDYDKLIELLDKSIEKDSVNAGAHYVYSLLYLTPRYPDYDIDSSYYFINKALADLDDMEPKAVEDLEKIDMSAAHMNEQKLLVEHQAFRRAKAKNTITDYNFFMRRFEGAIQSDSALVFRNELAYNAGGKTVNPAASTTITKA